MTETMQMNGSVPNGEMNGSTSYGKATVDGLSKAESVPSAPGKYSREDLQLVLQSFRLLIADLCEQFNMGHPGFVFANRLHSIELTLTEQGSYRYGSYRGRPVEVWHAVCSKQSVMVQQRSFRALQWSVRP